MMSLLTRKVFNRLLLKNIIYSESNLMQARCYTCLNGSGGLQFEKLGHQQISNVNAARDITHYFGKAGAFISNSFDKFLNIKRNEEKKRVGCELYATLDEVKTDEFFTILQVPDTYFNWFKVIELHVWMLLFQLSSEKLMYARTGILEAMWMDMESRASMVDKFNLNYKKNFQYLYNRFRQAIFWYDYGYMESDKALANVVWAVLLEKKIDDPEKLEAVVRFIRYQMKHLETVDLKSPGVEKQTGIWTPLKPHCKGFLT